MEQSLADLAARGLENIRAREEGNVIQLPLWDEPKRGTPNTFLRSALFAGIQGKNRRWMEREVLPALSGITVRYTGQQLTQCDLDVWDTLVHLARTTPLGTECSFTGYGILKKLGRSTGKSDHEWLNGSIIRLGACMVEISHDGRTYAGSLVEDLQRDDHTKAYHIRLNPNLIKLFYREDWTRLDWDQRYRLSKKPLAQALHAFWSSHQYPKPIGVEKLHDITGSNYKHLRQFKGKLILALKELKELGFLTEFDVSRSPVSGMDIVTVKRSVGDAIRSLPNPR